MMLTDDQARALKPGDTVYRPYSRKDGTTCCFARLVKAVAFRGARASVCVDSDLPTEEWLGVAELSAVPVGEVIDPAD